ncbi:hypothetical protein E2320_021803 [Naja naja]|nr:hypothetical protein E2320_021803 [Naja naja]
MSFRDDLKMDIKMATNFSTRYKKDLSIDTFKTKIVRRKSTIQKENRYKEFNKGRQFGLVDVNTQPSRDKATSQLGEKHEGCVPKPNAAAKTREQERMEMLQRYKVEKELRRLKEQRDKPFKCGQFKPDLPALLSKVSQIPVLKKSKEKVESSYTSKGCNRQIAQQEQKQIYIDKPSKQKNKGNLPQKRVTIKGKQQKEIIKERTTVVHNTNQDIPVEQEKEVKLQPAEISEQKDFLDKQNMSAPPKRNRSFAPQNFVFQPPRGLTTYKVKPMTPSRANMFLSPNLSWSPSETTNEAYKEETQDDDPQLSPNPEGTKETTERRQNALDLLGEIKGEWVPSEKKDNIVFEGESSVQQPDLLATEISEPTTKLLHDVSYFRNILQSERERLTSFCLEWDKTVEIDIPEEGKRENTKHLVRTTIGQTRLLMAERFKQFEGLIDNCEFRRGEKETTYTDLDGFWDMVNFQVEDINKKFENLKKLEVNGWQMVDDAQTHRPAKKKPILRRTAKAAGGSAERRAARKRFAAVKAAMKKKSKEQLAAEASGQVIPKEAERIFDGGFFRIESPAKPFPGRTPKSTDRISQWRTPRSANKALLQNCAEICVLQDTLSTSKAIPPIPDPKAFSDSAGTNHLGSASKQSGIQATEELCVRTDTVEIATVTASCDGSSSSSDRDVYQFKEASEIGDEVKQTTRDEVKQGFLSPAENSQVAETCHQDEVPHTPERLSCDDGTYDLQPNLDVSLFFTPLRNEAEICISADSCSNLIVFSPFPDEEK